MLQKYKLHKVLLILMFKLKSGSIISLKIFFYIFLYQKRNKKTNKTNKGFEKRLVKDIKIIQKKKKTKSEYMVVNDIEISLKKKETKSVSMVVNDIVTLQKMKNHG